MSILTNTCAILCVFFGFCGSKCYIYMMITNIKNCSWRLLNISQTHTTTHLCLILGNHINLIITQKRLNLFDFNWSTNYVWSSDGNDYIQDVIKYYY